MTRGCDHRWNSAITLYLARRLASEQNRRGHALQVPTLGCGEGTALRLLNEEGHELYGYDLPYRTEVLEKKLGPFFKEQYADRIRISRDGKAPFSDAYFDVVYANQVLEHVEDLDGVLEEAARILKPDGTFFILLPLVTTLVEPPVGVPAVHWLPAGRIRRSYLVAWSLIRRVVTGRPQRPWQTAAQQETYLRDRTYYRTLQAVWCSGRAHFGRIEVETRLLLRAKLEMLGAEAGALQRATQIFREQSFDRFVAILVTYFFNAALRLDSPRTGSRVA